MANQCVIELSCLDTDDLTIFNMFIITPSIGTYSVHCRRKDLDPDEGVDFSFNTRNFEMIEYYLKSISSDYNKCQWSVELYIVDLDTIANANFQKLVENVSLSMAPIIDYELKDINTLKQQVNKFINFMENIEIIPQDLPDLIPVSIFDSSVSVPLESNTEVALEQIYDDDSSDDVVFIQEP
jgi:hypothetical protein